MVGLIISLATLTKLTGLGLLVPLGFVALAQARKRKCMAPLLFAGVAGVEVMVVDGWWFWRNWVLYGDPFATNLLMVLLGPRTTPWSSAEIRFFFGLLWKSYWLDFSYGGALFAEREVYYIIGFVFILSFLGLAIAIRQEKRLRSLFLLIGGWFVIIFVSFLQLTRRTAMIMGGGRLLFPAAVAVGATMAVGLASLFRRRLAMPIIAALLFGVYAAIAPGRYLQWYPRPLRYLASPAFTWSPSKIADNFQFVGEIFQNGVQLVGYETKVRDLRGGMEMYLSLYWRVESSLRQRYRVFVQLGPQDPTRYVTGQDTLLGDEIYPSEIWQTEEIVRQLHRLSIPNGASAPGLYWIRIGLVDRANNRVKLRDGLSDMVVLGPWRMRAISATPSPGCATDYRLGEAIRLTGYDLEQMGEALEVTLHWQAEHTPEADYTVFVHLLDEEGNLVAQHDGPPREGSYPTSWWLSEQVILDRHTIQLTEPISGPTRLLVGLYDPLTLARLPAYDGQGQRLPNDAIPLTEVTPQGDSRCASD